MKRKPTIANATEAALIAFAFETDARELLKEYSTEELREHLRRFVLKLKSRK